MISMHNIQPTSLEAYFGEVLPTLNERQGQVLNIFLENPAMDFTNMELADELGWSINRVTPRVYELRGEGKNNPLKHNPLLIENRRRPCRVTNRTAIAWAFNPDRKRNRW